LRNALVTTIFRRGGFSTEAEADPDNPARKGVGAKIAANLAGSGSSFDTPHERVGEFDSPQLGAFGGMIGGVKGLVVFDECGRRDDDKTNCRLGSCCPWWMAFAAARRHFTGRPWSASAHRCT
jgi:hypothetical protein